MIDVDRSKPIEFSNHARDKMLDRGATESEVIEAIRTGSASQLEKDESSSAKTWNFTANGVESFMPLNK